MTATMVLPARDFAARTERHRDDRNKGRAKRRNARCGPRFWLGAFGEPEEIENARGPGDIVRTLRK